MNSSIMSKSAAATPSSSMMRPCSITMPASDHLGCVKRKPVLWIFHGELVEAERPLVPVGKPPPAIGGHRSLLPESPAPARRLPASREIGQRRRARSTAAPQILVLVDLAKEPAVPESVAETAKESIDPR